MKFIIKAVSKDKKEVKALLVPIDAEAKLELENILIYIRNYISGRTGRQGGGIVLDSSDYYSTNVYLLMKATVENAFGHNKIAFIKALPQ